MVCPDSKKQRWSDGYKQLNSGSSFWGRQGHFSTKIYCLLCSSILIQVRHSPPLTIWVREPENHWIGKWVRKCMLFWVILPSKSISSLNYHLPFWRIYSKKECLKTKQKQKQIKKKKEENDNKETQHSLEQLQCCHASSEFALSAFKSVVHSGN